MSTLKNSNFNQTDMKKLIRYCILFVCCIIVIIQLSECFLKLRQPPISTHSRYDFNSTLLMPAVTVCREPPYKMNILGKYGLGDHPKYSIHWRNFPFDTTNMTDVFEQATYNFEESFVQYALSKDQNLIQVTNNLHFNLGQCHTLRAIRPSKHYKKENGLSLMLQHTDFKSEFVNTFYSPGWHIFIHDGKDNFTEMKMKVSGKIEYIFAEVEEEIEIKLQTQKFQMMEDADTCSNNADYSAPKCGEMAMWKTITDETNCSGPWMDVNLPFCENYASMKKLIDNYMSIYDGNIEPYCDCLNPCTSTVYSVTVQNRKNFKQPFPRTQLWVYFTSKLVSIVEERPGYDLSQFIADLGGSLGFLLGLSVLGLIEILEKILIVIVSNMRSKLKSNQSNCVIEKQENKESFKKQNDMKVTNSSFLNNCANLKQSNLTYDEVLRNHYSMV